jgi:hypothetical protein
MPQKKIMLVPLCFAFFSHLRIYGLVWQFPARKDGSCRPHLDLNGENSAE